MTNLKDAIYDIQELITNKEEIFNDEKETIIKIDEEYDEEVDEEIETEESTDQIMEEQEELENQSAKEQNIKLRNEWYQFSAHCVPAKYKLEYVHANANNRNEEIIKDWYKECERIGLLPDKFKSIPEDQEQVIEKQPEKRKSFHKRRKEEWKNRKASKTQFTVKDKMEKQEEKKEAILQRK